ncbi:MAG: hypothetical protein M0P27_05060 [Bacteroidales bacterium]|nr:hypothetical protein [Bacteroidales bacterium]
MSLPITGSFILYSEQGVDLQTLQGDLDLARGTYADIKQIRMAQARLYSEILETDQVIWCSRDQSEVVSLDSPKFLHVIEADCRDIVAVLDGFLWEHIIGNRRCVPPEEHERMRFSCCSSGGNRHGILKSLEDDYISKNLPADPWKSVVVSNIDHPMAQILLGWPLKYSMIKNVKKIIREQTHAGLQNGPRSRGPF